MRTNKLNYAHNLRFLYVQNISLCVHVKKIVRIKRADRINMRFYVFYKCIREITFRVILPIAKRKEFPPAYIHRCTDHEVRVAENKAKHQQIKARP